MVNPLISKALNVSKKPPERPEAIPPVPEEYVGDNNPYRGTEAHGVPQSDKPHMLAPPQATGEGIVYLPPEDEPEPIPVVIRTEHGREMRRWRAWSIFMRQNEDTLVAPRNESRISLRVLNASVADNQWISPDPINPNGVFNLFKLTPSMGSFSIDTQEDIHALTDAANGSFIQVLEIYAQEL